MRQSVKSVQSAAKNLLISSCSSFRSSVSLRPSSDLCPRLQLAPCPYHDPVVNAPYNQNDFQWSLNKDRSLKSFDQTMVVGQGKNRHEVDAKFDPKKNQTTIRVRDNSQSGNEGDKDKDHKDKKIVK